MIKNGRRGFDIPYSKNLETANLVQQVEAYMGGGAELYAKMQEQMTELLDRVYAKHHFSPDTKLSWLWTWYTYTPTERKQNVVSKVVGAINNLDKKGRLDLTFRFLKDRDDLRKTIIGGNHTRQVVG